MAIIDLEALEKLAVETNQAPLYSKAVDIDCYSPEMERAALRIDVLLLLETLKDHSVDYTPVPFSKARDARTLEFPIDLEDLEELAIETKRAPLHSNTWLADTTYEIKQLALMLDALAMFKYITVPPPLSKQVDPTVLRNAIALDSAIMRMLEVEND